MNSVPTRAQKGKRYASEDDDPHFYGKSQNEGNRHNPNGCYSLVIWDVHSNSPYIGKKYSSKLALMKRL
jgi:hypothetical protein